MCIFRGLPKIHKISIGHTTRCYLSTELSQYLNYFKNWSKRLEYFPFFFFSNQHIQEKVILNSVRLFFLISTVTKCAAVYEGCSHCVYTVYECECLSASPEGMGCTDVSFRFHLLHQWKHWNFPGLHARRHRADTRCLLLSRKGKSAYTPCFSSLPRRLPACASLPSVAKCELQTFVLKKRFQKTERWQYLCGQALQPLCFRELPV